MARGPHWLVFAAASVFVAVAGILIVAAAFSRPPWLDELTTLYYTDGGLDDLLARYRRDAHPIGYYLPVYLVGRFSDSLGLLRVGAFALIVGSISAIAAVLSKNVREWGRMLLVLGPALVGTAVFVDRAGDLRTYGALSTATLVLVAALYVADLKLDSVTFALATAGLVGVAVLHVWGTISALSIGAVVVACNWRRLRPRDAVAPLVGLLVVYEAYRYGPLEAENIRSMLQFDFVDSLRMVRDGVSPNLAVFLALAVLWVVSLAYDRRSLLVFDLPAGITLGAALVISLDTPIFKAYVIIAVAVLLVAGMLVRLRREPWLYVVALGLLAVNFVMAAGDLFEEYDDFGASTAYVRSLGLDLGDGGCPLYVYPTYRDLFHSHYFLGDLPLAPIEQVDQCACGEAWMLVNHATARRQRQLLAGVDYQVVAQWDEALLARTECSVD